MTLDDNQKICYLISNKITKGVAMLSSSRIFEERVDEIIGYLDSIYEVTYEDALYDCIMACYREDLPYDHKEYYSGVYDGFIGNKCSMSDVGYKIGYEVGTVVAERLTMVE